MLQWPSIYVSSKFTGGLGPPPAPHPPFTGDWIPHLHPIPHLLVIDVYSVLMTKEYLNFNKLKTAISNFLK